MNENTNSSLVPSGGAAMEQPRTLEMIGAEIRTFTASMLNNIIEIGRRMCEAKELLPYGQFGDWIKANTGYSRSTANNFMRIYQEYGARQGSLFGATLENEQAFGKLSYTQALALLDVPAEEREKFVEENHVEEMSTRELQHAIAQRDEAIKQMKAAQASANDLKLDLQTAEARIETIRQEARDEARESAAEIKELSDKVKELEARPAETVPDQEAIDKAVAEAVKKAEVSHAAELEKLKTEEARKRADLEKKASAAEKSAKAAKEKLQKAEHDARVFSDTEGAKAEAQAAAEELAQAKAEADKAKAEAERLRLELAMSGEATVTFKLYFAAWQKDYLNMMAALEKADEDTAGRLKAAIKAQMEGWSNA